MKTFGKNLIPGIHIHINPINRDLLVITAMGLLAAMAMVTVLVMIVSRF
jgi:hypothetical protein